MIKAILMMDPLPMVDPIPTMVDSISMLSPNPVVNLIHLVDIPQSHEYNPIAFNAGP